MQSSVYFLADRFGFLSLANGAVTTPFVIENGQTVINDAVIGTGRITNAMVRNLDAEKINAGYLNVDRLNAGSLTAKMATLTDAYIKTANIGIAQVDTLRIASGAVVVNNSVSFSMRIGVYSGITTASVSISLNVAARISSCRSTASGDYRWENDPHGEWTSNFGLNGIAPASWLSGQLDPGTYTLTVTFPRPWDGYGYASGDIALMGLLR